ncbi:phage tail tape measure protein, lambda family [Litoreibacter ascidiaceicola]|uniref:Phage tail tape measure protein, lambda family n=1 Tax=Litoreibacter ascidiaceicola TaxID=1486859 RepID=A0A1M4ST25_9RHOB|nr:phage tail tape measure protein [Litoreibacter ascidiaceicola]SHE35157.1 phage tail tape measure protein, lambda family [Litoreibacter ascidiaceicola]
MGVLDGIDGLEGRIEGLESSLGGAEVVVSTFETELAAMRSTMLYTSKEVASLSLSIGGGLRKAFDGLAFDGMKLSDALKTVAESMINAAYNTAMRPIQNGLGEVIANGMNGLVSGILPFEKGGTFSQGRVMPFAKGGVVSSPTNFAMRGGMGLMGEAGPEAIMPLARGPDGSLGVRAGGGSQPVQVVMNISTPDVAGFQRSQSQIAAQMGRALSRGQRNR